MRKNAPAGPLAENRRARFDYEILETYEAGLELSGPEVKSVRAGRLVLAGSHALVRGGEAWLLNAQIPAYQPKNAGNDYEPDRTRRLLLHRAEIAALTGKLAEKGLALVPLKAYSSHGLVKIELGLARSRKAQDKREAIKKRETEREIRRVRG
ncbi:MAG TPA: SsrA-binding protein SmpB [Armatimonadota bacterium]|nr:SsrA-binding protein SmpB [Armatimonadota bacterium]